MRRSLPHMSASAVSALLSDVDEHGIPELSQRYHFTEAKWADADILLILFLLETRLQIWCWFFFRSRLLTFCSEPRRSISTKHTGLWLKLSS